MDLKFIAFLCVLSLVMGMGAIDCNVKGCQFCNTPNVCAVCQQNYVMQEVTGSDFPICLRASCPENCANCNQINQCQSCQSGYELSMEGLCSESQEPVNSVKQTVRILVDDENQADDNQGWNNSTGNCTTVPGCLLCPGEGDCTKCKNNYTLNSRGVCISCNVDKCQSCSIPDVCDQCDSTDPSLELSIFSDECLTCDQEAVGDGCLFCSDSNFCGLCFNGFQLEIPDASANGVCVQCQIENCRKCGVNAGNTICKKCDPGYSPTPDKDKCVQCLYPCNTCTDKEGPNNCATCTTPFFFRKPKDDGSCRKKLVNGCQEVEAADQTRCAKCEDGFKLESTTETTKCIWFCPENCAACKTETSCDTCAIGFVRGSTGKCNKCQAKGCAVCAEDTIECQTCMKGFYENNLGECKACPGFCADCASATVCLELQISRFLILLLIDGQSMLAVCDSSCITCSNKNPEICIECAEGFFLKKGKCKKCSGNCMTCDENDPAKCLSCYPSNFLSSGTCVACGESCMTCSSASAPNSCTSCWDGSYLSGTECIKGCPENCFTCSNATTCTECLSGYTLFSEGSDVNCAPCVSSCRTCAEGQPSQCLECGEGFYLSGSECTPCVDDCSECTAAGCTKCAEDFFMTSEQTCAPNCILPCATCKSTDPTACLSCIAGYKFDDVNGVCVEVTSCASGCIACPMGHSLKEAACVACSTSNCQSCNVENLTECFSCKPTYYLDDAGSCASCPAQCRTCLSGTGCLTCAAGFTKKKNGLIKAGGAECVKCNAPCATCAFTPNNCRSCVDGYKFFGWKCGQRFRFAFRIKLMVRLIIFNRNFFSFIRLFARAMKGGNNAVTCDKITEGSVNLVGSAAPTGAEGSTEAADQLQSLNDLIRSGDIAGMSVGEAQITLPEGGVGTASASSTSNQTLGLILGICIPLGILLIVAIIVFFVYRNRQGQMLEDKDYQDSHKGFNSYESEDKFDTAL